MILYLKACTDLKDLMIDYIEIKLVTGEIVSLNWDESDIERLDNGFNARYKGIYFDEEYANGKLDCLYGMEIDKLGIYAESGSYSDIVVTEMTFDDIGCQYNSDHFLPYVTSMKGCVMT